MVSKRLDSMGGNMARMTDSPTPLDQVDESSQVDEGGFTSQFQPAFNGLAGLVKGAVFKLAPSNTNPTHQSFSDWAKLDLDDHGTAGKKDDGSAYRIITVSCRLFIKAKKQQSHTSPKGFCWIIEEAPYDLLPTALRHLAQDNDYGVPYFQIGWIDTYIEPEDRHELSSILINKHRCVPVYLEKGEVDGFYYGFCKGVLWPLLHYSLRTKTFVNMFKHFPMYERVNERFADAVLRIYRKGDVVWIHDYHVLLTAKKIRETIPTAIIGFFMHSPFPTVELFRQLPVRKDLLEGMLAADVIGFNAYSHCNHHRAACEALLSIDTEARGLLASDGRFVRTHITPAGVDFEALEKIITSPQLQQQLVRKREEGSLGGLHIVVGRSRKLDEAQGTLLRLQGFEEFLKVNKAWRGKVVLLEVVDQTAVAADSELQALVQETVGNINGRYGELGRPPPVHLVQPRESESFSMEESCELYMLAHVILVTPLRDGLSLSSHEAVVCQGDFPRPDGTVWKGNKAPLILSEFAGAATALGGSIIVNPHNVAQVARELLRALTMTEEQKEEAHSHNFKYVKRNTTAFWADACIRELTSTNAPAVPNFSMELKSHPATLQLMRKQYMTCQSRLLLLDWDGSLVKLMLAREAVLPEDVEEVLEHICADTDNTVYIMSGRQRSELDEMFKSFSGVDRLGFIAEHGGYVKPPGGLWTTLVTRTEWIPQIEDLLADYTDRTPRSVTEVKDSSMTWHWRDADHDFAGWMEKDLLVQLHQRMSALPFTCYVGRRSVEIHARGISKVLATQWILQTQGQKHDFILAVGDDREDEDLFEFLHANVELRTERQTPPLGISPPGHFVPEYSLTGSMRKTQSSDTLPLGRKTAAGASKKGQVFFSPDTKRWTVKIGPISTKTHASASIESQKDAIKVLQQITENAAAPWSKPMRTGSIQIASPQPENYGLGLSSSTLLSPPPVMT